MAYRIFEQTEEAQREELIQKIEASVRSMSLRELEALCYELSTKNYINVRLCDCQKHFLLRCLLWRVCFLYGLSIYGWRPSPSPRKADGS